jgi:hypothetical protein
MRLTAFISRSLIDSGARSANNFVKPEIKQQSEPLQSTR